MLLASLRSIIAAIQIEKIIGHVLCKVQLNKNLPDINFEKLGLGELAESFDECQIGEFIVRQSDSLDELDRFEFNDVLLSLEWPLPAFRDRLDLMLVKSVTILYFTVKYLLISSSSQLRPEQSRALALLLYSQAARIGSVSGSSVFCQRFVSSFAKLEQGATFSVAVETRKGLTAIRSSSSIAAPFRASNVEQETDANVCNLMFCSCSTVKTPKFSNQKRSPS